MSFDSSNMERGEFCQDLCVCLLLAECMQDVGAAEPDAEHHRMQCENARYKLCTQARSIVTSGDYHEVH